MQERGGAGRSVVGSWDRFRVKKRETVGAPSGALGAWAVEEAVGRSAVGCAQRRCVDGAQHRFEMQILVERRGAKPKPRTPGLSRTVPLDFQPSTVRPFGIERARHGGSGCTDDESDAAERA